jgi:predicted metal-binding protein
MTREPGDLPLRCCALPGGVLRWKRRSRWQIRKCESASAPHIQLSWNAALIKDQPNIEPDVTIFVCTNCRAGSEDDSRPGIGLIHALRQATAHLPLSVKPVTCLANCEKSPSAAFRHRSGWSYVFGHLALGNVDDIVHGAMMLAQDERGFLPLRGRPSCLRGKGMTARIPPFHHHEDLPQ